MPKPICHLAFAISLFPIHFQPVLLPLILSFAMPTTYTNDLIEESSPYLLQHAHNPVDWKPWGEEAFAKAEAEDKLVLVSIGYSSCHWCHVMERESFEDEEVAAIMNQFFVPIKVDREERPDVDQVYMTAVQLMTQQGGWPLNCFALPDGRPIFGGTYFPKQGWKDALRQLAAVYQDEREKVLEYAERLTNGVQQAELIDVPEGEPAIDTALLGKMVGQWANRFDREHGGEAKTPKFPLPNNWQFLLRYGHLKGDKDVLGQVRLTLDQMAFGGIYDQLGGGFARYSTDRRWKVPHFEKMLYDNAQLTSLYAEAYQATGEPLYRSIVEETLAWVEREMYDDVHGGFFSAIDADSEEEEGKFYVWTKEQLHQELEEEEYDLIRDHYNINEHGQWEGDRFILLRRQSDEELAKARGLELHEYQTAIDKIRQKLFEERERRTRPALDDKSLTSWNALMLKGFVDAYRVLGEEHYLTLARKNAAFLETHQWREDGGLNRNFREGGSSINAYLEDYAFVIQAFTALYEATFEESWLDKARRLCDYTLEHFHDEESGMFWYTSKLDDPLIARSFNVMDNVLPAANSQMARNLFYLGQYFDNTGWEDLSTRMLYTVQDKMPREGAMFSNWGQLLLHHAFPFYQVAIVGEEADDRRRELETRYLPNKLLLGSTDESALPLLQGKLRPDTTTIYVCHDKVCEEPVVEVKEAVGLMSQ